MTTKRRRAIAKRERWNPPKMCKDCSLRTVHPGLTVCRECGKETVELLEAVHVDVTKKMAEEKS